MDIPEVPKGFSYEPGLILSQTSNDDEERWQDKALCHGAESLFDIPDDTEVDYDYLLEDPVARKQYHRARAEEVQYRRRAAKKLCYECPVFQECWDDAFHGPDGKVPDYGVIRAATALTNWFAVKREAALIVSLAKYDEHMERKKKRDERARRRRKSVTVG